MNIRHEIDPDLVQKNIQEKIALIEELRSKAKQKLTEEFKVYNESLIKKTKYCWVIPKHEDYGLIDSMYDEYIEKEKNRYSTVKILEIDNTDGNHFFLVYESEDIFVIDGMEYPNRYFYCGIGTGPFDSYEQAKEWFLKFGR